MNWELLIESICITALVLAGGIAAFTLWATLRQKDFETDAESLEQYHLKASMRESADRINLLECIRQTNIPEAKADLWAQLREMEAEHKKLFDARVDQISDAKIKAGMR